jgi:hypothetical protein
MLVNGGLSRDAKGHLFLPLTTDLGAIMAISAKYKRYTKDLTNYFKRATKAGDLYPSYSGYTAWNEGYRAGMAEGMKRGIQQTEDKYRG